MNREEAETVLVSRNSSSNNRSRGGNAAVRKRGSLGVDSCRKERERIFDV